MGKRVFIVEDDKAIIEVYITILRMTGFEVVGWAHSGEEALRKFSSMKSWPDVVIMDQRLPLKNGIDTMREMRKMAPSVRVVFVSADMSARGPAMAAGASGFVQKPFGMRELIAALEKEGAGAKP